ncbi:hypothetical protein [Rhodopirellula sp. MGV]|uniref:hypothetical protein n=1 Tax=Rhodopirellula sp. MGV TaxID=2023130 RepID=UPI000BD450B5|nr:hypothetical protein [Rhodopirellula sp. MGV]OYP35624.1 hypothetical protein CGZ80_11140 [Rhodopirellula sp. MGV]PNY34040.1 hypothetical protein C2E31_25405 [Rhodopirellula baltica]PNY35649.1 hypothetical protein C2E31_17080 [Rhodopirellula baltica]
MTEDPQQVWTDYYARMRRRRIAEARILHSRMAADGITDDTILALDFMHFGNVESDVRELAAQLATSYTMTVTRRPDFTYWSVEGTTRPYGIDCMNADRCVDWVAFMCDVANSYGCVFSTWMLTDPTRQRSWSNETIDVDPG